MTAIFSAPPVEPAVFQFFLISCTTHVIHPDHLTLSTAQSGSVTVAQTDAACQPQLSARHLSISGVEQVVADSTPFLALLDLETPSDAFREDFVWGHQLDSPHLARFEVHVATRDLFGIIRTTCEVIELVYRVLQPCFFSIAIYLFDPVGLSCSVYGIIGVNLASRQAHLAAYIFHHSKRQVGSTANVSPSFVFEDHWDSLPGDF